MRAWQLIVVVFMAINMVEASPGDKLKRFKRCVRECESINCSRKGHSQWDFVPFNKNLELLLWTCAQDCDYQCQRIITRERIRRKVEIFQFHGKWPFKRIFGIQEFVSMIFSLGNLIPHVFGLLKLKKYLALSDQYETKLQLLVLMVSSVFTCFAWLFSTIFHTRDFLITERLDYYFAGLTVLGGCFTITVRLFGLYKREKAAQFISTTAFFVAVYSAHIYRLVTDWGYVYNMQANITVGVIQNIFMILHCYNLYSRYYYLPQPQINHKKYTDRILWGSFFKRSDKLFSLYPLLLGAIIITGMLMEVFDFPPKFDLVDAHSLWHLATIIPVCYGWYEWLIWDVLENIQTDTKKIN